MYHSIFQKDSSIISIKYVIFLFSIKILSMRKDNIPFDMGKSLGRYMWHFNINLFIYLFPAPHLLGSERPGVFLSNTWKNIRQQQFLKYRTKLSGSWINRDIIAYRRTLLNDYVYRSLVTISLYIQCRSSTLVQS